MKSICLYLHIHQPFRYCEYSVFDVSHNSNYFECNYSERQNNKRIFNKVAQKSYRPMLNLLEKKMNEFPNFKVSFSITGTWIEQAEKWAPDLIKKIKKMVERGQVEILGETYYHSLAFFFDRVEFNQQVKLHKEKIQSLFNFKPKVFRNTELAYNDELGKWADANGYIAVLAEGWDKILGWRSPNYVYKAYNCQNLRLLLKNYRLSDDIAFRFSDQTWNKWPLTAEKFKKCVEKECKKGELINLFMDFETFGEHQWRETGIFDFIDNFITIWLKDENNQFVTTSEAANIMPPVATVSMPETVTWADTERDLSAWLSNSLQKTSTEAIYALRRKILSCNDEALLKDWRLLTTSDHSYSMCTKYWNDGDVHAYFSAYASPYESYIYFINILRDLEYRIRHEKGRPKAPEP